MNVDAKVIYPELSYVLIGVAFNIFNEIGYGMGEKYYQTAFKIELEKNKIPFSKERKVEMRYKEEKIGNYFLDFVIDNKIVVELKVRPRLGYVHIKQVTDYLKSINLKLAIIIYFTQNGVKYRRVINNSYIK
ncbi:MAG: GxxExxY protein [bacterium]|nr:GxxExxY protein [bacterium]